MSCYIKRLSMMLVVKTAGQRQTLPGLSCVALAELRVRPRASLMPAQCSAAARGLASQSPFSTAFSTFYQTDQRRSNAGVKNSPMTFRMSSSSSGLRIGLAEVASCPVVSSSSGMSVPAVSGNPGTKCGSSTNVSSGTISGAREAGSGGMAVWATVVGGT